MLDVDARHETFRRAAPGPRRRDGRGLEQARRRHPERRRERRENAEGHVSGARFDRLHVLGVDVRALGGLRLRPPRLGPERTDVRGQISRKLSPCFRLDGRSRHVSETACVVRLIKPGISGITICDGGDFAFVETRASREGRGDPREARLRPMEACLSEDAMRRNALLFTFVVLFAACGSEDRTPTPTPVCAAGSSLPCTCPDGRSGAQVCSADGTGYGSCSCAGMTDAGCAMENGAAACNRFVGALCARIVMCCEASSTPCADWAYSETSCRARQIEGGFDCSSPDYTSTSVCSAPWDRCVGDIPLIACSDFIGGTVNLPASCQSL